MAKKIETKGRQELLSIQRMTLKAMAVSNIVVKNDRDAPLVRKHTILRDTKQRSSLVASLLMATGISQWLSNLVDNIKRNNDNNYGSILQRTEKLVIERGRETKPPHNENSRELMGGNGVHDVSVEKRNFVLSEPIPTCNNDVNPYHIHQYKCCMPEEQLKPTNMPPQEKRIPYLAPERKMRVWAYQDEIQRRENSKNSLI